MSGSARCNVTIACNIAKVVPYLSILALRKHNAQLVPQMWVTGFKLHSYGLHFCAINQTAFCYAL